MKTPYFYIWNTNTAQNYDPIENNFYGPCWEPVLEDENYLEGLMLSNPEKFKNCKIVDTREAVIIHNCCRLICFNSTVLHLGRFAGSF